MTKKKYCSHFTNIDKEQLDKMLKKIPTFKYVPKFTINGCIQRRFFLVNISRIAKKLGFNRKSIKAELVRGSCKTKTNFSNKDEATYSYSKDTSDAYRQSKLLNLKKEKQIVKN